MTSVRGTVAFLRKYAPGMVESPRRDKVGSTVLPLSVLLPVEGELSLEVLANESSLLHTHLRALLEVGCAETGPISVSAVSQGSLDLLFDLSPAQAAFLLNVADNAMSIANSVLSIRALSKAKAAEHLPAETRAAIEAQAEAYEAQKANALADGLIEEAKGRPEADVTRITELSSSFKSAIRFLIGKVRIGLEVEAALSIDYRIEKSGKTDTGASSRVRQAIEKSQKMRKRRLDEKKETPLLASGQPEEGGEPTPKPKKKRAARRKKS